MKKTTIQDIKIINLPRVEDRRGNLSIIEGDTIPYDIKRVYYLHDVPGSAERGGHAHKEQQEMLIAVSGSFDVIVNDGAGTHTYTLNHASRGLLIVEGIWRELKNFSSGAVCLVIASDMYNEEDYIRSFTAFKKYKKGL